MSVRSYGGTYHYISGPEPTQENPWPVGMVFTYQQGGGVFWAEVDPVTLKGGRPQRFRVEGKNEDGDIDLLPVFEDADGRFAPRYQRSKRG